MSEDGRIILKKGGSQTPIRITVVGCGGMGCNTLRTTKFPEGVKKIAVGANRKEISGTGAEAEIIISQADAEASAKSKPSKYAGSDGENELSYILKGSDIVFPVAGLGGGTGGWMASMVCRAAKLSKAGSMALVTTPFGREGMNRRQTSTKQLEALRNWANAVMPFKNDQILKEVPNLPIIKAFEVMNKVVSNPVQEFKGLDKAGLKEVRQKFEVSRVFKMDVAQWRGDGAIQRISEELGKSDWLRLKDLEPRCAIFFMEEFGANEDLANEMGDAFSRSIGSEIPMLFILDEHTVMRETRVSALVGL